MLDFAQARRMMVDCQLRTFDVNDLPLLVVMDDVPRERFVPEDHAAFAYIDRDIPVSDGLEAPERRFMLAPMVLARLIQSLDVRKGDKVSMSQGARLRVGGDGPARRVVIALEASEALAKAARERLGQCGVETVRTVAGPLDKGFAEAAPYDAILVNGAVEMKPQGLSNSSAKAAASPASRARAAPQRRSCTCVRATPSERAPCSTPQRRR